MLPDLIANLRGEIDWSDMQKTVRKCACMAQKKGYKVIHKQFVLLTNNAENCSKKFIDFHIVSNGGIP